MPEIDIPLLRKPPNGPVLSWQEGERRYEEDGERSGAFDLPRVAERPTRRRITDEEPFTFIPDEERRGRYLESGRLEIALSVDELNRMLGGPSGDVADRILAGAHDDALEELEFAEAKTAGRGDVLDAILERRVMASRKEQLEAEKEAVRKHS